MSVLLVRYYFKNANEVYIHCKKAIMTIILIHQITITMHFKYIILVYLYLPGGSVDIVVYEQSKDQTLKRLYPPTRERVGGISFDDEYEQFLKNIWDEDIIKILAEDHKEDYLILQNEFERYLRDASKTNVMIPLHFHELWKKKYKGDMKKALDSSIYRNITYRDYRLKLPQDVIMKFFQKSVQYVKDIIEQNRPNTDVKIIIIGGLAENNIFIKSLRDSFPTDWKIVIPHMAELAVLKGAVYYGHNSNIYSNKKSGTTDVL